MRRILSLSLCAAVMALPAAAQAATDAANFQVKLVITESCDIHTAAPTDVNFGVQARAAAAVSVTATGSVTVNCSPNTTYSIGLNGGNNASATPAPGDRRMQGGLGAFVPYDLYQDLAAITFWGNGAGSSVTGSGTGANQVYQVYGKLTNLNFPADTYADTVTATVTY